MSQQEAQIQTTAEVPFHTSEMLLWKGGTEEHRLKGIAGEKNSELL